MKFIVYGMLVIVLSGESITVEGSNSNQWSLSRKGSNYMCSCPSFLYQHKPTSQRSCKHLARLRGYEAEVQRIQDAAINTKRR
jgi:hypothetical protein